MKKKVYLFTKTMTVALCFFMYAYPAAAALPDTGQTLCYDDNGTVLDPCPSRGEPFYGQDGSYTINPPSYTKLDDSGAALPDNATTWAMVRDDGTGLVWENKQIAYDYVADYTNPHDPDNTYTWYDGDSGIPRIDNDTLDFIEAINADIYGGHDDWRLPTPHELMTIAYFGQTNPAIDTAFFTGTRNSLFWTDTTYVADTERAFCVSFDDGGLQQRRKSEAWHARAVRGSMPAQALADNGDGTVTDEATGLMWQQALSTTNRTWATALDYCETLELAGYTDWRSPTIKELYSIMDYSQADPAITPGFFTGLTGAPLSSTSNHQNRDYSYNIYLSYGGANWFQKTTTGRAWAVRSDRPGLSIPACTVEPEPLNPGVEAAIACPAATDNGSIVEYRWDFGADGTVDNTTSGGSIAATYAAAGSYLARVIAENTGGLNAGRSFSVRVIDCIDADGDGYGDNCSAGFDCDDTNSAVFPGAEEICNGIDDNCDNQIDEGLTLTFYQDGDGDGYGNAAIATQACETPAGYVTDNTDCDDTDPSVHDNCTNCTVHLKPSAISRLFSMLLPLRRIVITAEGASVFPENPEVTWSGDGIETLSVRSRNDTTLIVWVRLKPRLLVTNETYTVTVGDCTGSVSIRGF
ncbi:MAG: DUF1566 domain-containing protein [Deltaproteobacteria bacterium]|nr:DUF1566 domain-containing protein [Deltaproteobacteria bacterium]